MSSRHNEKITPWACILPIVLAVGLTACGGGGGSTTTATTNGDGETLSTVSKGIAVPGNVSAVPAQNTSSNSSSAAKSFSKSLRAIAKAANPSGLASTTDYAQAMPNIYVEERALEQFEMITQIMKMLAQTNYADASNVNQGPYQAMVSWVDEQNGKDIKVMQTWTVDSRMIVETLPSDVTGNTTEDVNRLMAWIPETNSETGMEELIKAEFKIYTPPTSASDGSLLDFGEWDMNVLFGADTTGVDTIPSGGATDFFAASARINANGTSTLKVHDKFTEMFDGNESTEELRGILIRSGSDGYGAVQYPDWDSCRYFDPGVSDGDGVSSSDNPSSNLNPCATGIPVKSVEYSYNANYMGVQEIDENNVAADVIYKDRDLDEAIRLVHRYDLFYAADGTNGTMSWSEGDNIQRYTNFGFPISYLRTPTGGSSVEYDEYSYYGAWQGRHQIWGQDLTATTNGIDGTEFTRQDVAPGQTVPTYKMVEFNGTLAKRDVITSDLNDIKDIAVETWINDSYDVIWNGSAWESCVNGYMDFWTDLNNPQCLDFEGQAKIFSIFDAFADLSPDASGKKWVSINRWSDGGTPDNFSDDMNVNYVYLTANPGIDDLTFTGEGFYIADWDQNGGGLTALTDANNGGKYSPANGENMFINISGSLYITYTGDFTAPNTGWVVKEVTGFDDRTWMATFGDGSNDIAFDPDQGTEYYLNANGSNYIVKRKAKSDPPVASDYEVMLELQTAANPVNVISILPEGTDYLAAPWASNIHYSFVTDSNDDNYMALIYKTDDPNTQGVDESSTPTMRTNGEWGLQAYNENGQPLGLDSNNNVVAVTVDEWGYPTGDQRPTEFNWEYSAETGGWGSQQYLVDASDITDYMILSDPISLVNVGLYDNLSAKVTSDGLDLASDEANWKKVSLQYDGWMQGLPDLYFELEKADWDITGMGDKVRLLIEGQEVLDAAGVRYFVKPMDISLFLATVTTFPNGEQPNMTLADAADLDTVPDYTPHSMDAAPTTNLDGGALVVKYSEGQPIE